MESLKTDKDEPFEMEKLYTVATKYYISMGKDGFSMFQDPSVETLPPHTDECRSIQDVLIQFFSNFRKSEEEIDQMPECAKRIFEHRLIQFGSSRQNRCPKTGFIHINPQVDGRIIEIGEPIKHMD